MTWLNHCCALGLAGALACGERGTVYEGEYVTLIVDPALEPCGDMAGHMNRVVGTLVDYLGVSLPDGPFSYIWYSEERFAVESSCGVWTGPCESEGVIQSTSPFADATLVRLVLALVGSPPLFFQAGALVVFTPGAGSFTESFYPYSAGDVQQLLASRQLNYWLSGGFTRFLIDRHGLEAYLAFYASVGEKDPLPVIEAAYAAQFGESLTETELAFFAEHHWCPARSFRLFECSAPSIAWDGDALLLRRSLACGEDDVVGPFEDGTARILSTLEVETAGTYEISLAADEQAGMLLGGCGGCEDDTEVWLAVGQEPVRQWLPAGRYYLHLGGDAEAATELALRIERVDEP